MSLNESDVQFFFYDPDHHAAGYRLNRKVACRAVHLPTGLYAVSSVERLASKNKEIALRRLEDEVDRYKKENQE